MSIQVRAKRSGITRALGALVVLVGVFAMHGLTGNHDVTMVEPHLSAMSSPADGHTKAAHDAVISADEHDHAMDGVCLAMLTALALLLTLLLGLRSLLVWRAVQFAVPVERSVLTGRSPPWLAPSLSKLCVLRT
ncbi:MAG: hypothetical protein QOF10_1095 [Kribbellaceae bacterium]|jgi:hypothetical protein|nr:hypothetical protein [Kribbellaceae bacterium]